MTTSGEIPRLSITELSAKLRARVLSPVEVTRACLDRIGALNDVLKAFISVYPDAAMDAAQEAEAEIADGHYRGPLHGVPLGIKDLFQVKGMKRTCGSRLIEEDPGEEDADTVASLRAAGGIILGLTNLHEFAFGPTGINPYTGTALNPWDLGKVCGGSSSGSGCAVAAGLVPGALGTDTGGSVRLPSALCGVVGLKPTHLRLSQHGIYPLVGEFDTAGPIARSVADCAIMMAAMDPASGFGKYRPLETLEGIRIGIVEDFFESEIDPEVGRKTRAALQRLVDFGAKVVPHALPYASEVLEAWNTIALGRVYALHGERAEDPNCQLSPDVRARVLTGGNITAAQVDGALAVQAEVRLRLTDLMKEVDALALPTTPIPAVSASDGMGLLAGRPVDGAAVLGRLTRLASFTGQPAVTLPIGLTANNLPIGLQLIGDWQRDEDLLALAGCVEALCGLDERRPPALDSV